MRGKYNAAIKRAQAKMDAGRIRELEAEVERLRHQRDALFLAYERAQEGEGFPDGYGCELSEEAVILPVLTQLRH